jgi:hypothetical protein
MANEALIQGLIQTKNSLFRRVGDLYAEIATCQNDIQQVDQMLARYSATQPVEAAEPENEEEAAVADDEDAENAAEPEETTLEEIVEGLIKQYGPPDTARRVTEWLLRTGQIPNPSPVKAVFEAFPKPLIPHYNENKNSAAEALRHQIRSWIAKGDTSELLYSNGLVGIKLRAAEQDGEGVESR